MFLQLGEDCANVEVDLTWVRHLQRFGDRLVFSAVDASVLKFKTHLEVRQSVSELVGLPEETCVIIISNGAESVVVFTKHFRLLK